MALSPDPEKRRNQLANLKVGPVSHGASSEPTLAPLRAGFAAEFTERFPSADPAEISLLSHRRAQLELLQSWQDGMACFKTGSGAVSPRQANCLSGRPSRSSDSLRSCRRVRLTGRCHRLITARRLRLFVEVILMTSRKGENDLVSEMGKRDRARLSKALRSGEPAPRRRKPKKVEEPVSGVQVSDSTASLVAEEPFSGDGGPERGPIAPAPPPPIAESRLQAPVHKCKTRPCGCSLAALL